MSGRCHCSENYEKKERKEEMKKKSDVPLIASKFLSPEARRVTKHASCLTKM